MNENGSTVHMPLPEFAKYIPMRLSPEERSLLNVLENTLHVSEYTDHVDVTSSRRGIKSRRIFDGILEVIHIATGLAVASGDERSLLSSEAWNEAAAASSFPSKNMFRRKKNDKKKKKKKRKNGNNNNYNDDDAVDDNGEEEGGDGQPTSSFAGRDPRDNAILFQTMFEVGRRNKVLNPNRMRTTYGKLMVSKYKTLRSYRNKNHMSLIIAFVTIPQKSTCYRTRKVQPSPNHLVSRCTKRCYWWPRFLTNSTPQISCMIVGSWVQRSIFVTEMP
jgi:hypothetical protein